MAGLGLQLLPKLLPDHVRLGNLRLRLIGERDRASPRREQESADAPPCGYQFPGEGWAAGIAYERPCKITLRERRGAQRATAAFGRYRKRRAPIPGVRRA